MQSIIQSPDHYTMAYQAARDSIRQDLGDPNANIRVVDLYSVVTADVSADTADGKKYSFFSDSADFATLNQDDKVKLGDSIPSHLSIAIYGYSFAVDVGALDTGDDRMETIRTIRDGVLKLKIAGQTALAVRPPVQAMTGLVGGNADATATAEDQIGQCVPAGIVPLPVPRMLPPAATIDEASLTIDGSGYTTTQDFRMEFLLHCFVGSLS